MADTSQYTASGPSLNALFGVPEKSLGEIIMADIRDRMESGPYSIEEQFWADVRDWILGDGHSPDAWVDIFGVRRDGLADAYLDRALSKKSDGAKAANAMAGAFHLLRRAGGIPPLGMLMEAVEANSHCVNASAIILMADDFAACGNALRVIREEVGL